jgi:hypothetical protein
MKTVAVASLAALLLGCGGAQLTPTIVRGDKLSTMKQVQAALARGKHQCQIDEDTDLICDADKKDAPTIVVSYHSGTGGLHLAFLTAFPWKRDDPCPDVVKAVNNFNADAFSYHAVCTKKALVMLTMFVVPETGLTDHDVQAFINWWGPSAAQLALASPMASELK